MLGSTPPVRLLLRKATPVDLRLIARAFERKVPIDWDKACRIAALAPDQAKEMLDELEQIQAVFRAETPTIVDPNELRGGFKIHRGVNHDGAS